MEKVVVSLRDLEKARSSQAYSRLAAKSHADADALISKLFETETK